MTADDVRRRLEHLGVRYALIGAVAVAMRGHPRSTIDVDFMTTDQRVLTPDSWTGFNAEIRKGDAEDPLAGVVRLPRIDVVVMKHRWEQEILDRAEPLDFGEFVAPVPRASDLILLKLAAGGYKDQTDIVGLLESNDREPLVAEVNAMIDPLPNDAKKLWQQILTATTG